MRLIKRTYRAALAWLLRRVAGVARALPRRTALVLGESLGRLACGLAARSRGQVIANLRRAFAGGASSSRGRLGVCEECFVTFGRSLMETLRLPVASKEEILRAVDVSGFEEAERVLRRGKGALILTAHMGAWEVLAAWWAAHLGDQAYTLGKRIATAAYNDVLESTRRGAGVVTIYQDESPRRALRVLRDNRPLGILADQDIARLDSVFVEFFSVPARTPTAPVTLARASGAGIVPMFITWSGRRHRIRVMPEVELVRSDDKRADAVENTRRWSRVVEEAIRAHPEQWAWFHRRWRSRPPA